MTCECGRKIELEPVCNTCEFVSKGWIKVSDRLPSEEEDFLMTYNYFVLEGCFRNGKFYASCDCSHYPSSCTCEEQEGVTHWMPMPRSPNE